MGKMRVILMAIPALAIAGMAAAAMSGPLRPLSERDMGQSRESGCQTSFSQGNSTLIMLIGHDFMIHTADRLKICRISDRQFGGFGDGATKVSCAAMVLTMQRKGHTATHPDSDSSDGRAVLTIAKGASRQTLQGEWGTAC